jgi:hypothetical protein
VLVLVLVLRNRVFVIVLDPFVVVVFFRLFWPVSNSAYERHQHNQREEWKYEASHPGSTEGLFNGDRLYQSLSGADPPQLPGAVAQG